MPNPQIGDIVECTDQIRYYAIVTESMDSEDWFKVRNILAGNSRTIHSLYIHDIRLTDEVLRTILNLRDGIYYKNDDCAFTEIKHKHFNYGLRRIPLTNEKFNIEPYLVDGEIDCEKLDAECPHIRTLGQLHTCLKDSGITAKDIVEGIEYMKKWKK